MWGRKCGSRTRPVAMEKTSVQRPGEGPWVLPSRSRVTCGGSHRFSESRVLPLSRLLSPTPAESLTIWPPPSLLPRPQPQLHAQPTPAGRLGRPRPGGLLRARRDSQTPPRRLRAWEEGIGIVIAMFRKN